MKSILPEPILKTLPRPEYVENKPAEEIIIAARITSTAKDFYIVAGNKNHPEGMVFYGYVQDKTGGESGMQEISPLEFSFLEEDLGIRVRHDITFDKNLTIADIIGDK
jgi:hypothetical protein